MARKIPFKEADVLRAVKGARKAGMELGKVEIDPATGRIVIFAAEAVSTPRKALDKWLEGRRNA